MKRAGLTIVAAAAALFALQHFWQEHKRAAGLDFYIYFVAGQLAGRADVENIYAPEVQARVGDEYYERALRGSSDIRKYDAQRRRRLDNVSSPFLYSTLRWLSRDYERALLQYHVLVLVAFIGGVLLICRRAGLPWWAALLLVAGLLVVYRGFEADLRVGNVNSLQLFALGVALWVPPVAAGAILAMLLCFKPNLILVALLLIVSHDRARLKKEIAGGAIGGVIAFTIAAISYGPRSWLQWITAANQFWHRLPTRAERNVAPLLEVMQKYGEWVGYLVAALLTVAVCAVLWRTKRRDDVLVIGLGILIYLLSATVVWLHYMVLVLPIAIALMGWSGGRVAGLSGDLASGHLTTGQPDNPTTSAIVTAAIAILALAAIAEEPFELLTRVPVYPHDAKLIGPALAVLFVCGLWQLNRRPAANG